MAWEISISPAGWQEIYDKLEAWGRARLINAISDTFEEAGKEAAKAERKRLAGLPHDVLVDRAFELIEQNNTCDNGGWAYWIDREGFHKVFFDTRLKGKEENMSQDSENYWLAVQDVAQRIVDELTDADEDRNELLHRLLHEDTDQHDYVITDDLQVHVLRYSKHPCAALFNGTLPRFSSTDNFPFAAFAAEALEADVAQKVKELLTPA